MSLTPEQQMLLLQQQMALLQQRQALLFNATQHAGANIMPQMPIVQSAPIQPIFPSQPLFSPTQLVSAHPQTVLNPSPPKATADFAFLDPLARATAHVVPQPLAPTPLAAIQELNPIVSSSIQTSIEHAASPFPAVSQTVTLTLAHEPPNEVRLAFPAFESESLIFLG